MSRDTFYITKDILLRTQTSPIQARVMGGKLPIRMISRDAFSVRMKWMPMHSPSLPPDRGLVIDKGYHLCRFKGTLDVFAKELFG